MHEQCRSLSPSDLHAEKTAPGEWKSREQLRKPEQMGFNFGAPNLAYSVLHFEDMERTDYFVGVGNGSANSLKPLLIGLINQFELDMIE